MCLMQTDLPVPDGPRIIVIIPLGMPRLRPSSTVLRPKRLTTSMNSTVSSRPWPRIVPWYSNFSEAAAPSRTPSLMLISSPGCPPTRRSVLSSATALTPLYSLDGDGSMLAAAHPPIGARGFAPQKICEPIIPIRCTSTMFRIIDLAVAWPTPTGPPEAV